MNNVSIYVVSHKEYHMPDQSGYIPIQVGYNKANFDGFIRDNTGDNIAYKNKNYCELTALYWIWKNSKSDIVGLLHYRRLLASGNRTLCKPMANKSNLLTSRQIESDLEYCDFILPKKHCYITETAKQHYIHNHHSEGLELTRDTIARLYPSYLQSWNKALDKRSSHLLNIMICKKPELDNYCAWLFSILEEVEKTLDISNYSDYEARVFGYLAELLVDVYINANNLKYKEYPILFAEKQNPIEHYKKSILGKLGKLSPDTGK